MTEKFDCASCAAPLDFEGTPVQKCKFCGSTVIVPQELIRGNDFHPNNPAGMELDLAEVLKLIANGNKIAAIKLFRETFDVGLKEAKVAVESIEGGRGAILSSTRTADIKGAWSTNDSIAKRQLTSRVVKPILGSILLIFLLTAGFVATILYVTYRSVDRAFNNAVNPITKRGTTQSLPANELLKFGGKGSGPGRFSDNRYIGVDSSGGIYSAEYQGGRVQTFDRTGIFISQWTAGATIIADMAVGRDGVVYVLDARGIAAYDGSSGKLQRRIERPNLAGIAVTADGRVVAAGRKGIAILSDSLATISDRKDALTRANALKGFTHVAVDGLDNVYAVDASNREICKFAADGQFLKRISTDVSSPNSIAIDPKGRLFISDTSKMIAIDENGLPLGSFPVDQAFGSAFNDDGELLIASRPFVVKYSLGF
ncbi:MAG: hypothetical protein IPN51_12565 [Chloracidobacterium sp.]|nr:hypothetical protein [Chloracidobacterium sp.]